MRRWIIDALGVALFTPLFNWLLKKLPVLLTENAVVGWLDSAIGDYFGLTAPTVATLVAFTWNWGMPAVAAIITVWLWHLIAKRWANSPADAPIQQLSSSGTRYRPTANEVPPYYFRGRWWYEFWGGPPFHVYAARKRLEFMDSWQRVADQRRQEIKETQPSDRLTSTATATVTPAPKYSKAQINRILEAIDAFYPPLLEIEQTLRFGTGLAGSLEAIIRDRGAAPLLAEMDQLRLKLIDPLDRLDRAVEHFGLYTEVCRVLNERESQKDAFFSAFNDLVGVLRQLPNQLSAPALAIFVEAKKATFIERTTTYCVWALQKKKTLAELRESYLERPTTD